MPKVSICLTAYNGARYLPQAIESALGQRYADYEIVISDNGSTDETPNICRSYASSRLRYFRFTDRMGQSANTNYCVSQARGEYVAMLCHDDALGPSFLSRTAEALDRHPAVGLAHCAVRHMDSDGAALALQSLYDADRIDPGEVLLRRLLLDGCVINPSGVLVRRSLWNAVGGFTEKIVWGVDCHMWMRIALRSAAAFIAEPLAFYRDHPLNGTAGVLRSARNGPDEVWMLSDILAQIPAQRSDLRWLRAQALRGIAHRAWCFAEQLNLAGHGQAARAQLLAALRIKPAMLLEGRFAALWAATWLGHGWFDRMRNWKRRAIASEPSTARARTSRSADASDEAVVECRR